MARLTKALQQNSNAGSNRRHRDHRTHRTKDFLKKRHDRMWQDKRAKRLERGDRFDVKASQSDETMMLETNKVIVKEVMHEDAIGQWVQPLGYALEIAPIYIPVFKVCVNIAHGSLDEFKRFLLQKFEYKIEHEAARAMALSFEHKGVTWHFVNIQHNDWTAEDYGTIAHEIHHVAHFTLEKIGATYGLGGEEIYAYMQGRLMELVVRAFQQLHKAKKRRV